MNPEIKNYKKVLNKIIGRIKRYTADARLKTNGGLLDFYWQIGCVLLQEQGTEGWKSKAIIRLAADLKLTLPAQGGFSERNLRYMRSFAASYPYFIPHFPDQELHQNVDEGSGGGVKIPVSLLLKVSWYHHMVLLDKVADFEERLFYMQKAVDNGWGARTMGLQIKKGLYRRQSEAVNNFNDTMSVQAAFIAKSMFRSPYMLDFMTLEAGHKERELEEGLTQNLKSFMLALGRGFAYVGNQFTMPVAGTHYYLDLLFYNIHLHCYVVVELKVEEFIPEHIGKLNFYINKVDEALKGKNDNPTIGILLCKMRNEVLVRHALKGLRSPIGVAGYECGAATAVVV